MRFWWTLFLIYLATMSQCTKLQKPRTPEDELLFNYWESHSGCLYVEVPIGGEGGAGKWPKKCERRRIDGVLLPLLPKTSLFLSLTSKGYNFRNDLKLSAVELTEDTWDSYDKEW